MVSVRRGLDMQKLKSKNKSKPIVSILCLAYNQKDYIRSALDSFLMQETEFSFEVLIHDDASNDGTTDIIKEYENKYPEVIKPIYQRNNQFSQGVKITQKLQLPRAKGEYLAICEGDDYWTDKHKLQKQVDFLSKHKDHSIVFHPVKVIYEGSDKTEIYPLQKGPFNVTNLLKENYIQTNSVMYRTHSPYRSMNKNIMPGDWYMHLYHAQFGKIGFIDDVMGVYRRHESGIWYSSQLKNVDDIWIKYGISHLYLYFEMMKMFGRPKEHKHIIANHIVNMISNFVRIDEHRDTSLLQNAVDEFKEKNADIINYHNLVLREKNKEITNRDNTIKELQEVIEETRGRLKEKEQKLKQVESSRTWRIRSKAKSIKRRAGL